MPLSRPLTSSVKTGLKRYKSGGTAPASVFARITTAVKTWPHMDNEQEPNAEAIARAFVMALLQGTDKTKNKAHEVSPCSVCIWEDSVFLDNDTLRPVEK